MSGGTFGRRCRIVAAIVACTAGLVSGPGLWSRAAAADAGGVTGCTATALRLTVRGLGDAAGSSYYSIDLTNMSSRTCTLEGYPRVSFVSAPDGHRLGARAGHDPVYPGRRVILRSGRGAHARLRVGTAPDYPVAACHPVTVRWIRVRVRAAAGSLYASFAGTTCELPATPILSVARLQPGWGA